MVIPVLSPIRASRDSRGPSGFEQHAVTWCSEKTRHSVYPDKEYVTLKQYLQLCSSAGKGAGREFLKSGTFSGVAKVNHTFVGNYVRRYADFKIVEREASVLEAQSDADCIDDDDCDRGNYFPVRTKDDRKVVPMTSISRIIRICHEASRHQGEKSTWNLVGPPKMYGWMAWLEGRMQHLHGSNGCMHHLADG